MSRYYYVYFLPPDNGESEWHYAYYAFDRPAHEYPDNRIYYPQWIFYDQDAAGEYTDVEDFVVEKAPGRVRKMATKVARFFKHKPGCFRG